MRRQAPFQANTSISSRENGGQRNTPAAVPVTAMDEANARLLTKYSCTPTVAVIVRQALPIPEIDNTNEYSHLIRQSAQLASLLELSLSHDVIRARKCIDDRSTLALKTSQLKSKIGKIGPWDLC